MTNRPISESLPSRSSSLTLSCVGLCSRHKTDSQTVNCRLTTANSGCSLFSVLSVPSVVEPLRIPSRRFPATSSRTVSRTESSLPYSLSLLSIPRRTEKTGGEGQPQRDICSSDTLHLYTRLVNVGAPTFASPSPQLTSRQSRITLFCYSMERPASRLHCFSVPQKFSAKGCPHREHHCTRARQTRF
jgi:hypothetical protein